MKPAASFKKNKQTSPLFLKHSSLSFLFFFWLYRADFKIFGKKVWVCLSGNAGNEQQKHEQSVWNSGGRNFIFILCNFKLKYVTIKLNEVTMMV